MPRFATPTGLAALSLSGVLFAAPAAACDYRFTVANTADVPITLRIETVEVRSRGGAFGAWGPWRRASRGGWFDTIARLRLNPDEEQMDLYATALLCSDRRQFRAVYVCRGGPQQGSSYSNTVEDDGSHSEADRWVRLSLGQRC